MEAYRPLIIPTDNRCPLCGRPFEIKHGAHCGFCHQKFYDKDKLPVKDEQIVYIRIGKSFGFGPIEFYYIAVNTKTNKYVGKWYKYLNNEPLPIILPDYLVNRISKNMDQLLYSEIPKDDRLVYDNATYSVDIEMGNKQYHNSFDCEKVGYWPIIKEIVDCL